MIRSRGRPFAARTRAPPCRSWSSPRGGSGRCSRYRGSRGSARTICLARPAEARVAVVEVLAQLRLRGASRARDADAGGARGQSAVLPLLLLPLLLLLLLLSRSWSLPSDAPACPSSRSLRRTTSGQRIRWPARRRSFGERIGRCYRFRAARAADDHRAGSSWHPGRRATAFHRGSRDHGEDDGPERADSPGSTAFPHRAGRQAEHLHEDGLCPCGWSARGPGCTRRGPGRGSPSPVWPFQSSPSMSRAPVAEVKVVGGPSAALVTRLQVERERPAPLAPADVGVERPVLHRPQGVQDERASFQPVLRECIEHRVRTVVVIFQLSPPVPAARGADKLELREEGADEAGRRRMYGAT